MKYSNWNPRRKDKKRQEDREERRGIKGERDRDREWESEREIDNRTEAKIWRFKEVMAKTFPKLMKDINLLIHKALQTPNRMNIKKITSWQT